MKKLFLILFCMIFLVWTSIGVVSALNFDNVKNYDEVTKTVTVDNAFGLGDTIATIQLKSELVVHVVAGKDVLVAEFEINNNQKYSNVFNDMEFYDLDKGGEKFDRDFVYKFLNKNKEWEIFYHLEDLPNGKITIGIFTEVLPNDHVEWIPTLFGIEIEEWAEWSEGLDDGLTHYYPFDEAAGAVAEDVRGRDIGNQRNFTLTGNTSFSAGKIGNALNCATDGMGNTTGGFGGFPNGTNDWTINLWFNVDDNEGGIFDMLGTSNFYTYISAASNTTRTYIGGTDFGSPAAQSFLPNVWYMFTITRNTTGAFIWKNNGTLIDSGNPGGAITEDFFLVCNSVTGVYLNGSIDELGIWNRSLTVNEVSKLYNGGNGLNYSQAYLKVSQNSPVDNIITINKSIFFNCTSTDRTKVDNITFYINGVVNETKNGDGSDFLEFSKLINVDYGNHNWSCRAIDEDYNIANTPTRFFNISQWIENSQTFNVDSFETKNEIFAMNISTELTPTNAYLVYNGTTYSDANITNTEGDNYNISRAIEIPNSVGNKTFYFNVTFDGVESNLISQYQYVNYTLLQLCNVTLAIPYINFTFVDEETLTNINATIDTSTWVYYLGGGTNTKTTLYSNTTVNDYYAFCFSASNDTMHNVRSIQYASPGYPQRKYDAVNDLTNTTTNQILYLLSSTDGIYSTIQVLDSQSNQLQGVGVTAERQFAGLWTVVGQEVTDSAGSVTFWVNPDYNHRFTFTKEGCTGTTINIRPTQTQYTQQLSCGVTSDYTATIEGLKYSRTPVGGILQPGVYNFTYYLVSSKANIINSSFYIVNGTDQTVLNSSVSACTVSGCLLYFTYNVTQGEDIKGRYYVDVGNGSILIEGDAWWRCIEIPTAGKAGVATFFKDVIYIFQEWGSDTDTADFNRLVVIFFLICIGISVLNYQFNMDSLNPGMFLSILTFIIIMGSIIGGSNPTAINHGLFYYNNLTTNAFINNYLLAGICMIITFASFLNINRQAQR